MGGILKIVFAFFTLKCQFSLFPVSENNAKLGGEGE